MSALDSPVSESQCIGYRHPPHTVEVEAGRLRAFAKAIGETDPVFVDEAAARAAGYRGVPAPPTYAFSLELDQARPFAMLEALGIRLQRVLHGTQRFRYLAPICAGDRIRLESVVEDQYEKSGGALAFVVIRTTATNQLDEVVVEMHKTVVVRRRRESR